MRLRTLLLIPTFIMLGLSSAFGQSADDQLILAQCSSDAIKIDCDIRFSDPKKITGAPKLLEIIWPNEQPIEPKFKAYNPNEDVTAWLFLFDRSRSLKSTTIKKIQEDFSKILSSLRAKEKVGIYTFADTLLPLARIGSPREVLKEALKELKAVGEKTYIYLNAQKAIDELVNVKANRRALVLVTDGQSEDFYGYNADSLIKYANKNNVVIYTVGYSETQSDTYTYYRDLYKIAAETQGPTNSAELWRKEQRLIPYFYVTPDQRLIVTHSSATNSFPLFGQYFMDYMQNGGSVSFPRLGKGLIDEFTIRITDENDRQYTKKVVVKSEVQNKFYDVIDLLGKENRPKVLIGLGTFVLIALAILSYLLLRPGRTQTASAFGGASSGLLVSGAGGHSAIGPTARVSHGGATSRSGTMGAGPTVIDPSNAPTDIKRSPSSSSQGADTYGWFEMQDASKKRILIDQTTMSIGRHSDNKIQLDDSSVHRRHASLFMTPDRDFMLSDRSDESGNGVIVNSKRVNGEIQLNNGDLIELGEVKLKFYKATV